jgi:hypothetical protein
MFLPHCLRHRHPNPACVDAHVLANQRMDQSGRGRRLSQAGTTRRWTVQFLDRAAAPQVMRGR